MRILKPILTAALLAAPAAAQEQGLDDLFDALRQAEGPAAERIVAKIGEEFARTGSPAIDLLLGRGREAMEAGDFVAATQHFGAAIDHAPDVAEAYNGRATALFRLDLYGPALDDIRQALAHEPRHFGAMTGMALILGDMGRPDDALAVWRRVLEIYPDSPQARAVMPALERDSEGRTL